MATVAQQTVAQQVEALENAAARLPSLQSQIEDLTKQLSAAKAALLAQKTTYDKQTEDLNREIVRLTGSIGGINYQVYARGAFAISATTANYPASTLAGAVGGTQTGLEGTIKRGHYWIVTNATGKKFAGMAANFTFDTAIVIAIVDNPGNTASNWRVDSLNYEQTAVNQNPVVNLVTPSNGASFTTGSAVTVSYTATDPEGQGLTVVLLVNDVAQSLTPTSNSFSWTPPGAGSYTLKVRATDPQGGTATTSGVSVSVSAPSSTRTFIDGINIADSVNRTIGGNTYKPYDAGHPQTGWSHSQLNTQGFSWYAQNQLSPAPADAAEYNAIINCGYDVLSLAKASLVAGTYEVEIATNHFYNTAAYPLRVNGTLVTVPGTGVDGVYWKKTTVTVVLSTTGSITISDDAKVSNASNPGNARISYIGIFKLS